MFRKLLSLCRCYVKMQHFSVLKCLDTFQLVQACTRMECRNKHILFLSHKQHLEFKTHSSGFNLQC